MGKLPTIGKNVPTNSSLSFTLENLQTFVRLTLLEKADKDQWRPLVRAGIETLPMSEKSIERYLKHFSFLKTQWGIEQNFLIESGNNFPADCGLASSASSFAALTKAAVEMFQKISPNSSVSIQQIADWSRQGSGSSCRSFYGPWCLWYSEGVRLLEFPLGNLSHQVVVVEGQKKTVSSSEAHKRVTTSLLFDGRAHRAETRLAELMVAMKKADWEQIFEICWSEFWDMHALFETSAPSFGYMSAASLEVLSLVRSIWSQYQDGPVVTMDAGPNVHLLWRADQVSLRDQFSVRLNNKYKIITSAE